MHSSVNVVCMHNPNGIHDFANLLLLVLSCCCCVVFIIFFSQPPLLPSCSTGACGRGNGLSSNGSERDSRGGGGGKVRSIFMILTIFSAAVCALCCMKSSNIACQGEISSEISKVAFKCWWCKALRHSSTGLGCAAETLSLTGMFVHMTGFTLAGLRQLCLTALPVSTCTGYLGVQLHKVL